LWQISYFYLICHYLKLKLKRVNKEIKFRIKSKITYNNSKEIIDSLTSIYLEIDDYNRNYWSKYLLFVWVLLGSNISFMLYFSIMSEMSLIFKLMFIYAAIIIAFTFLFLINTASLINFEACNSYQLLNTYLIHKCEKSNSLTNLIKVCISCSFFYLLIINYQ
jgi:hypothetical protein